MIASPTTGRTAWSGQRQIPPQGLNSTAWLVGLVQRGNRKSLFSSKTDNIVGPTRYIEEGLVSSKIDRHRYLQGYYLLRRMVFKTRYLAGTNVLSDFRSFPSFQDNSQCRQQRQPSHS